MADSTIVNGDAHLSACLRRAGMMAIHVYNNDPAQVAAAIRSRYQRVSSEWDVAWQRGISASVNDPASKRATAITMGDQPAADVATISGDSGFFARLYTPKIPDGKSSDDVCPPVLAFRGSEQKDEEFRDLAATLTVVCDVVARPTTLGSIVADGHVMARYGFYIRLDPFSAWEQATIERATHGPSLERGTLIDQVMSSFVSEKIWYPGDDQTVEAMVTRLMATANFNLPHTQVLIESDQDLKLRNGVVYDTHLLVRSRVTAHYGQHGDWAANVYQGMGGVGDQYTAVRDAVDIAAPIAMANWNNRLNITGHSLGGGLAAAAALYASKAYPDLVLGAITYNAAGVHENTAAAMSGAKLSDALSLPIVGKVVRDEILNSLGARGLIPFVSDIFRWQNRYMPLPTGLVHKHVGISPGLFPVGGDPNHQLDLGSDGDHLPFLFPLTAQTMFTAPYVVNYRVPRGHSVGSGGAAPRGFEPNALDAMSDAAAGTTPDWGSLQPVGYLERSPGAQDMERLKRLAGMSASASTFDEFIANAVRYLFNEGTRAIEARRDIWNYFSPTSAGTIDMMQGISELLDELTAEGKLFGGLFAASASYHPMDVAGSTFLRE